MVQDTNAPTSRSCHASCGAKGRLDVQVGHAGGIVRLCYTAASLALVRARTGAATLGARAFAEVVRRTDCMRTLPGSAAGAVALVIAVHVVDARRLIRGALHALVVRGRAGALAAARRVVAVVRHAAMVGRAAAAAPARSIAVLRLQSRAFGLPSGSENPPHPKSASQHAASV